MPASPPSFRNATRSSTVALWLLVALACATGGCRSLATDPNRLESYAEAPVGHVRLARVTDDLRARRGAEQCGFLPIESNRDALEWRLALVDAAERTLDIKYYIWRPHASSRLLLDRICDAVERGVRVRLLLDDMYLQGKDEGVALLDTHPNIEVRIYNPWRGRDGGWLARGLEAMTRFDEINHRMHNKLIAADNHLAIVGGRNVGDEYFGLNEPYNVRDFDLLVAGPAVAELSRTFDDFWNSELSYPGDQLMESVDAEDWPDARALLDEALRDDEAHLEAFASMPHVRGTRLSGLADRMYAGVARVVGNEPVDDVDEYEGDKVHVLRVFAAAAEHELLFCTPYLVLSDHSLEAVDRVIAQGVSVRVLTNSLSTHNQPLAYSGYRKDRRFLLDSGLDLYEFRADSDQHGLCDTPPAESEWLLLHQKLIIVDRRRLYVGTYNLDPRSANINAELGLLIDCPPLAAAAAEMLDRDMSPENAWRVKRDDEGRMYWESGAGTTYEPPARTWDQRLDDFFYGLLPLESQM